MFGNRQCRGYDNCARMVDCFLVYIVELERVRRCSVSEGSHCWRRATVGADNCASPIATGVQSMTMCCACPWLIDAENDTSERVQQCVIGLAQQRGVDGLDLIGEAGQK